jgi:molybdopterin/thiamine biosynthesis adenylyltransferase
MDANEALLHLAEDIRDQVGRQMRILRHERAIELAEKSGQSPHDIYMSALEAGIWPLRFLRNTSAISLEEQLRLMKSCVSVAGAGGLGGNVVILLARLGVGRIIVIDPDRFEETNLNRQALCRQEVLGRYKADEASSAAASINPATLVISHRQRLTDENAVELLAGSSIAVDALDTVEARFVLERGAKALGIPLVHGAVAGFEGQVMTVFPEDRGLVLIYGQGVERRKGRAAPEHELGVPAPTASAVANLQVMEVLKLLLNKGNPVRNAMLHLDLMSAEVAHLLFQ